MTNEDLALTLATNRKHLKQRLHEAKAVLPSSIGKTFGKGTFDFEKKQLIGENGYILQWRVRLHPELYDSYQNQQTSRGTVVVLSPKSTPEQRMTG